MATEPETDATTSDQLKIATDRHGFVHVHGMGWVLVLLLIIAIGTTVAAVQLVDIRCGLGASCNNAQTTTSSEP